MKYWVCSWGVPMCPLCPCTHRREITGSPGDKETLQRVSEVYGDEGPGCQARRILADLFPPAQDFLAEVAKDLEDDEVRNTLKALTQESRTSAIGELVLVEQEDLVERYLNE